MSNPFDSDCEFDLKEEKRVPSVEELRAIAESKQQKKRTSTRRDANIQDKKPKAARISKAGKKLAAEESEARLPKELQHLSIAKEAAERVAMIGIKELIYQQMKGFADLYIRSNAKEKKFLDNEVFKMLDQFNVTALNNTKENITYAFNEASK